MTKPNWAITQIVRHDLLWKLLEDICQHGCGHPNQEWLAKYDPDGKQMYGIHGCDGCCKKEN